MTQLTADFEAGTNGNTITTSDTGSADAWDNVVISGATYKYVNDSVAHGSLAAQLAQGTNSSSYLEWTSLGAITDYYGRIYFRTEVVNATRVLAAAYNANGLCWYIYTNATGNIGIDKGNLGTTPSVTTSTILADTWYRIEFHISHSSSEAATDGSCELKFFDNSNIDGSTPDDTVTSAANMGMRANATKMRYGIGCGVATYPNTIVYFDDLVIGATSYPGPAGVGPVSESGGSSSQTNLVASLARRPHHGFARVPKSGR